MTKNAILDLQKQLKTELETIQQTIEPPAGRMINLKGKVFTLPDGSSSSDPIDIVILDWRAYNTYFTGNYNPNKLEAPVCFALNKNIIDMQPAKSAPNPQNEFCNKQPGGKPCCPRNEWGSDPGGGKGKACKNTRKLAVISAHSDKKDVFILQVSPTGIKHFEKMVNHLAKMDLHPVQMITRVSFVEDSAYPTLRFEAVAQHEMLEEAMSFRDEATELLDKLPEVKED